MPERVLLFTGSSGVIGSGKGNTCSVLQAVQMAAERTGKPMEWCGCGG